MVAPVVPNQFEVGNRSVAVNRRESAKSDRMHRNKSARWGCAIAFPACYHDQDLPKDGWNA
jgi:hypothetical protein